MTDINFSSRDIAVLRDFAKDMLRIPLHLMTREEQGVIKRIVEQLPEPWVDGIYHYKSPNFKYANLYYVINGRYSKRLSEDWSADDFNPCPVVKDGWVRVGDLPECEQCHMPGQHKMDCSNR